MLRFTCDREQACKNSVFHKNISLAKISPILIVSTIHGKTYQKLIITVKGLSKEKKTLHRQREHYGDYQKESRMGDTDEGKGGINGDGRRLDLGR